MITTPITADLLRGALDLERTEHGGNVLSIDMAAGSTELEPGPVGTLRFTDLPAGDKNVEVWLPHNETTELVALRTDAPVEPAPASGRKVWLHHGSSISHGSDAANPTGTWPAAAALEAGLGLINLGLVREELARIVKQRAADPNLRYLDGRELYGPADTAELPLPDQLHPDAATHRRIGERFAKLAFTGVGQEA